MIGVIRGDARSLDYCSCKDFLGIRPDSPVVSTRRDHREHHRREDCGLASLGLRL